VNRASHVHADGNVYGTAWGGWLSAWLNSQFSARDNNIDTRATWGWVNQWFVQDIRQSGIMNLYVGTNANNHTPEGGVVIGAIVHGTWDNNEELKYTWLQRNINGTWMTIGRA
ncbi:TPA: phage tail protein, partial [Salmonella enterica]